MKPSQEKHSRKWEASNRERANYIRSRSSARSFFKNKATLEDIEEFEKILQERKTFLSKSVDKTI